MFKPKQKEFESKSGNKYVFQTVLPSKWAEITDRITDKHGKMLSAKAMPEVLEHVVVQPQGLRMDDFETYAELEEIVLEAFTFQSKGK